MADSDEKRLRFSRTSFSKSAAAACVGTGAVACGYHDTRTNKYCDTFRPKSAPCQLRNAESPVQDDISAFGDAQDVGYMLRDRCGGKMKQVELWFLQHMELLCAHDTNAQASLTKTATRGNRYISLA